MLPDEKDLLLYLVEVPDSEFPFHPGDVEIIAERLSSTDQEKFREAVREHTARIDQERADG